MNLSPFLDLKIFPETDPRLSNTAVRAHLDFFKDMERPIWKVYE